MPTTEGYNGAYTGQQIDEGIRKANEALPAPTGGTPGQILSKTETGQEWVDKPVMYVNITESGGTYSADKTAAEIYDAVQSGYAVFARVEQDAVLWLYASSSDSSMFVAQVGSSAISLNLFDTDGETVCALSSYALSGSNIRFTPASGLTSTNVQDAIEEVAEKAPTSTTITLASAGWTGDSAPFSQQVSCSIVAADTPVVSVDAQTSGDLDANAEILNAWALVSQKDPKQGAGTMTFYATEKPTVNIPVKVGVS